MLCSLLLERVMNLGENRIEMRIPRRLGSLAISVSRIPKAFLIEFITRSRLAFTFPVLSL
jgi:hypothetical protein